MEQSSLTKEQIERATKREGVQHPVVSVLEYHEPRIAQLKGYSTLTSNQEQQDYIRKNYGFLGDALEEAGGFSLGPLDLVAVWSKALEIWSDNRYPRYRLAGMLATAYGIQGRPDLKGLVRHYLETSKLLERIVRDKSGLILVRNRLDDIHTSLDELEFYVSGVKGSSMELAFQLAGKARDGDEEARKQLNQLIARDKEYLTPVLKELHENFGNGMVPFGLTINSAIQGEEI